MREGAILFRRNVPPAGAGELLVERGGNAFWRDLDQKIVQHGCRFELGPFGDDGDMNRDRNALRSAADDPGERIGCRAAIVRQPCGIVGFATLRQIGEKQDSVVDLAFDDIGRKRNLEHSRC